MRECWINVYMHPLRHGRIWSSHPEKIRNWAVLQSEGLAAQGVHTLYRIHVKMKGDA
jgi:hypothetical protein